MSMPSFTDGVEDSKLMHLHLHNCYQYSWKWDLDAYIYQKTVINNKQSKKLKN